ncbi:MAG: hypothetical protein Q4A49_03910 [Neisseria sp.]|nr:hypothetical protein [Neisseria sp.]
MKKYVWAVVAALWVCSAAAAGSADRLQKIELVKSVYKPYFDSEKRTDVFAMPNKFTQDFLSVFEEDERNTPDGYVGCIGYDPIINGQDWSDALLKKSLKVKILDGNRVEATFLQWGNRVTKVRYVLQCTGSRCLIDDILLQFPEEKKFSSFKKSIRSCIAEN